MTQTRVDPIEPADFPEVARFVAAQAGPREPAGPGSHDPVRRLHWALLENPARLDDVPPGWCVRDDQRIVGTLLCVPFRIGVGDFATTALMASKFYVDLAYRGQGIGPLMRYLNEGRRFPLLVTSANEASGAIYRKSGGYLIEGLDHTMLGVAWPGPLAEEWTFRRAGRAAAWLSALPVKLLRQKLRLDASAGELSPLTSAEAVDALGLAPPGTAATIIRDRNYIHWRYFSHPSRGELFRFRLSGQPDRMTAVELVRSGYRRQIRVLDVLDLWPPTDAQSAPALAVSLSSQYAGRFDAIRLRSQPPASEAKLADAGFVPHVFPAPLGWCIDRSNLLPTRQWYLMPGESE